MTARDDLSQRETWQVSGKANRVSDLALARSPIRGDALLRRFSRHLRHALGVSVSADIHRITSAVRTVRQPILTSRAITLFSMRGGAGTTTVTALLAIVLACHRPERILAIDADPREGTLRGRLGAPKTPNLPDFTTLHFRDISAPLLDHHFLRCLKNLWLLPGHDESVEPDRAQTSCLEAFSWLGQFFAIQLIDSGAQWKSPGGDILLNSHLRILVAPYTAHGVMTARLGLDRLIASGPRGSLRQTVVVLLNHSPHGAINFRRARHVLGREGAGVVPIPYDRYLAAGTQIDLRFLAESSWMAGLYLAAEILFRSFSG